jgi:hypothetical protein
MWEEVYEGGRPAGEATAFRALCATSVIMTCPVVCICESSCVLDGTSDLL